MLNIKELRESLDSALEKETYESLICWFQERDKEKVDANTIIKRK